MTTQRFPFSLDGAAVDSAGMRDAMSALGSVAGVPTSPREVRVTPKNGRWAGASRSAFGLPVYEYTPWSTMLCSPGRELNRAFDSRSGSTQMLLAVEIRATENGIFDVRRCTTTGGDPRHSNGTRMFAGNPTADRTSLLEAPTNLAEADDWGQGQSGNPSGRSDKPIAVLADLMCCSIEDLG